MAVANHGKQIFRVVVRSTGVRGRRCVRHSSVSVQVAKQLVTDFFVLCAADFKSIRTMFEVRCMCCLKAESAFFQDDVGKKMPEGNLRLLEADLYRRTSLFIAHQAALRELCMAAECGKAA